MPQQDKPSRTVPASIAAPRDYHAVIMAGGGGTRLWPLSRHGNPKQSLDLTGDGTFFQQSVGRLKGLFADDHIWVVSVAAQVEELRAQCPSIPPDHFLTEPRPAGTAAAIGLAASALQQSDPGATMAVLTADHLIQNEARFRELLAQAYHVAQEDWLVTLGISPTYPATGYGYIERGDRIGDFSGADVYRVNHFKEKPDLETARRFLAEGRYYWNSGLFIWRVSRILDEFEEHMPELHHQLERVSRAWPSTDREHVLTDAWSSLRPQTIDYGVMEKAEHVAVLPAEGLGWNDIGTWESLFEVLEPDEQNNIVLRARHLGLDTDDTLVYSTNEERIVATIGLENMIIVDTPDAILICPRDQAQRVRDLVSLLAERGYEAYL